MKKINPILIAVICLFLTGCTVENVSSYDKLKAKSEITVGVKEDSPPFGYLENGEYKGFDIDVANLVFSKLFEYDKKKIVFKTVTAQNKIMKLNSGEVDFVVAIVSITPQRQEIVDFTLPYFIAGQAILVKDNSTVKSIEDLNNKDVTVILGSTGEKVLRKLAPNARIKGADTYEKAFNTLKKGETQAIYGDDSILYGLLLKEKGYKILSKRYTKEYYAIAYRKDKNNRELAERLDFILNEIQTNGELNKIKYKWIPKTELAN